jgi:hypothetical protein
VCGTVAYALVFSRGIQEEVLKENGRQRREVEELEMHLSGRGVTKMGDLLSKPASGSYEKRNPDP